jgi:hypothetical protein
MQVDSRTVQGRRELHFESLDDMIEDAEHASSASSCPTLGNWSLNQLLMHLATAMNASIDGIPFTAPWYLRFFGMAIKRGVLKNGVRPGFNLPKERESSAFPTAPTTADALETFRKAANRLRQERASAIHPVFGQLTHDEWLRMHLRHAEMHLSFAVLE